MEPSVNITSDAGGRVLGEGVGISNSFVGLETLARTRHPVRSSKVTRKTVVIAAVYEGQAGRDICGQALYDLRSSLHQDLRTCRSRRR